MLPHLSASLITCKAIHISITSLHNFDICYSRSPFTFCTVL
uniref:Uncharacterized protein n=1 Tax=Arundo donax TaxID=35708 RepID=A0A0A9HIJ8_ARUDO